MIRLTFLLVLTSMFSLQAFAQHDHDRGVCGTNEIDIERTKANIAYAKANPLQSRMTTYVPIRFHLIGESDGTNAVSPNNVLDLMSAINVDFAAYDVKFFLEDGDGDVWDYTYDDRIYGDHASFLPFMRSVKSTNAITIFVPNTATPPNSSGLGVTLGYYSPSEDWLVFKKSEVSGNASTATHEIGHYFSLPHTFRGWDCTSWTGTTNDNGFATSPVTITSANFCSSSGVQIELVSRGTDGNCATAADLFCDTPADYNLGFGWDDCEYTGGVQDATGTPLEPAENNFMGYFIDCNPYEFSPEQIATVTADMASNGRNFLRGTTPTTTTDIVDEIAFNSPADGASTFYSDRVTIDWENTPNAKYYYVEVGESRSFRTIVYTGVVSSSNLALDNLEGNKTYYYRVRAFSQVSFGDYGTIRTFRTGAVSSINAQPEAVASMTLFPNPAAAGASTTLKIESLVGGEITLTVRDLTGRTLASAVELVSAGDNSIDLVGLMPRVKGSYTLSISNEKGVSSQKFQVL
ncbi:MAG: T9SS type A sorting domain-containing protein [Saprospiraceae bacterium]